MEETSWLHHHCGICIRAKLEALVGYDIHPPWTKVAESDSLSVRSCCPPKTLHTTERWWVRAVLSGEEGVGRERDRETEREREEQS